MKNEWKFSILVGDCGLFVRKQKVILKNFISWCNFLSKSCKKQILLIITYFNCRSRNSKCRLRYSSWLFCGEQSHMSWHTVCGFWNVAWQLINSKCLIVMSSQTQRFFTNKLFNLLMKFEIWYFTFLCRLHIVFFFFFFKSGICQLIPQLLLNAKKTTSWKHSLMIVGESEIVIRWQKKKCG